MAAQFLAVSLTPAWGAAAPHAHLARGTVSAAQWERHMQEHRRASLPLLISDCAGSGADPSRPIMASVPEATGIVAFFLLTTANRDGTKIEIPIVETPHAVRGESSFYAFEISFAPPEPPPNL